MTSESLLPLLAIGAPGDGLREYNKKYTAAEKQRDKRLEACRTKATTEFQKRNVDLKQELAEAEAFEALERKAIEFNSQKVQEDVGNGSVVSVTKRPNQPRGVTTPIPNNGIYTARKRVPVVTTILCCIPSTAYENKIVYTYVQSASKTKLEWALVKDQTGNFVSKPLVGGRLRWE